MSEAQIIEFLKLNSDFFSKDSRMAVGKGIVTVT